ncbi:dual specificity mitogen-activated protein kinase kinase 2-like isoform 1 [Aphelenchoides avenae]|nr:dual specificity mitogen-activated protein kinase kinase 2-like isoform 1 [Aphelenchus avenae]
MAEAGFYPRERPRRLDFGLKSPDERTDTAISSYLSKVTCDSFDPADIEEQGELGRGARGVVHRVRHRTTGREMARKTIPLVIRADQKQIQRELHVLFSCRSHLITEFCAINFEVSSLQIFVELMELSLDDLLSAVGFVPGENIKWIALNVLNGVDYLKKELSVLHRDLKPANILANRAGQVKLCDMSVSGTLVNSIAMSVVGTQCYMSPERLCGEPYSVLAEVWSIGITLMELAMGRHPFPPTTEGDLERLRGKMESLRSRKWEELKKLTKNCQGPGITIFELTHYVVDQPSPELPKCLFQSDIREFVSECLKKTPGERASIEHLRGHQYLKQALEASDEHQQKFSVLVKDAMEL